jgi:DNA primase
MTLFERGVPNAVASMGASLSEAQADFLAEYADHVSVLFDGDDAGRGGAEEARGRLEKCARGVHVVIHAA